MFRRVFLRLVSKIYPYVNTLVFFPIFCFWMPLVSATDLLTNWQRVSSSQPASLPAGAYFQEIQARSSDVQVQLYAVFFNEKKCRLYVLDNPPSAGVDLAAALRREGAFAGVNGAYFYENFEPLGLVISNRQLLHRLEKARLLSGILEIRENSIRLVRSNEFRFSKQIVGALQAGPFLLENGKMIRGLNKLRVARRTVVASDGKGNWALILMSPLTLAQAGELLASRDIFPKWRPWHALNLDGGSSSGFWADTRPSPVSIREFGAVRNFLGLRGRSPARSVVCSRTFGS